MSINRTELEAVLAEFVGAGIERSGRCVLVTDGVPTESLLEGLSRCGLDAEAAMLSGTLIIADRANTVDSSGTPLSRLTAGSPGRETWVVVVNPTLPDAQETFLQMAQDRVLSVREVCETNKLVLLEALETEQYPGYDPIDLLRMYPAVYSRGAVCRNRYYIQTGEFLESLDPESRLDTVLNDIRAVEQSESALHETQERLRNQVDSDKRLKTERVLRETYAMLRAVVQASPAAIVVFDPSLRVSTWNPAAEFLLGCPRRDVLGVRLSTYTTDGSPIEDLARNCFEGNRVAGQELTIQRKDGSEITLAFWTAPIIETDGSVTGVMVLMIDVTKAKELESQLIQAQKMEAIGRLAGGIAHDFNNLLLAILGTTELMLSREDLSEDTRFDVADIRRAADRASALTRQLLAFSRKQILQPRALDLNAVIADMHKMMSRLLKEDIELEMKLHPDLDHVKADPGQVEQIILNLVMNARDAMTDGGSISLSTASTTITASYDPETTGLPPGGYVVLEVRDSGCGMSEEVLAHIFEPFYTTKPADKGTGLGLSTVYGIVKQSGGGIVVESEPGKGSAFRVYLPSTQEEVPAGEVGTVTRSLRIGTETVLVVEDEDMVRGPVVKVLQMDGYETLEAGSGEEALKIIESFEGTIHLMVTDVVMPGMNGRELAEHVVKLRPGTKVLFMSGHMEELIIGQGVLAPGVPFLQKPFQMTVFADKVREMLDLPKKNRRRAC
ncbi:MAG: response regulator [Candidatus Hydrogenedentes bacterium]|nr:response regulator [Candidatus Hydrogenedentota bacterium]